MLEVEDGRDEDGRDSPVCPTGEFGRRMFFRMYRIAYVEPTQFVLDIGKRAFESSGIAYFEVPSSMTYIPENCFASSQLQEIIFFIINKP